MRNKKQTIIITIGKELERTQMKRKQQWKERVQGERMKKKMIGGGRKVKKELKYRGKNEKGKYRRKE